MTTPRIDWSADGDYRPRRIKESDAARRVSDYYELTGLKEPSKLQVPRQAYERFVTAEVPKAQAASKTAEAAVVAYPKTYRMEAAEAILSQVENGDAVLEMPEDRLPELEEIARLAATKAATVEAAKKVAHRVFLNEAARVGVDGMKLAKVWADLMTWEATDSLRENRRHEVHSTEVFAIIESLTLLVESADLSAQERQVWRKLFAARPAELPRLTDVRQVIDGRRENTPLAKAQKAYEEGKVQEAADRKRTAASYMTDAQRAKLADAAT